MAKTLAQLNKQIADLQKEAESIRKKEVAGVIGRIKEAIKHYDLTAADLGLSGARAATGAKPGKASRAAKYADDQGNSWSGRGPRPGWIKAAIAAGKQLEELLAKGGAATAKPAKAAKGKPGRNAKAAPVAKYSDGTSSWSGRGPKPGWFKAALAAGKTPDDLRASKAS